MNATQRKTLDSIFKNPVNGNIEWKKIESLFLALGCIKTERSGSSVIFEKNGVCARFHRPHPGKEALAYRIKATREFLSALGVKK